MFSRCLLVLAVMLATLTVLPLTSQAGGVEKSVDVTFYNHSSIGVFLAMYDKKDVHLICDTGPSKGSPVQCRKQMKFAGLQNGRVATKVYGEGIKVFCKFILDDSKSSIRISYNGGKQCEVSYE